MKHLLVSLIAVALIGGSQVVTYGCHCYLNTNEKGATETGQVKTVENERRLDQRKYLDSRETQGVGAEVLRPD